MTKYHTLSRFPALLGLLFVSLFLLPATLGASMRAAPSPRLVATLDSALASSAEYAAAKEARIEQLRRRQTPLLKEEERFWLNKMLYDEYFVYKADSAMHYVDSNIALARRRSRPDLVNEWLVNRAFLLAAQGLLSEAEKELKQIDVNSLDDEAKYAYYETAIYLYNHLSQYIGRNDGMTERYDSIATGLKHKALQYITPAHPSWFSLKASLLSGPSDPEWKAVKSGLKKQVDASNLNTRLGAMNAYALAKMCLAEGDSRGHVDYLLKSAIADTRMCNRDIASLEELSNIFYGRGDIDRAYAYVNHCLKAALLYPNRVRVVNISATIDKLQQASEQRNIKQEGKLADSLIVVSVLSVVLLLVVVVIVIQFFKLKHAHVKLMKSKTMLNEHMEELHSTQERLETVNRELKEANDKLRQSNDALVQSNYVKEEYVGYVFSICSEYLTKIEDLRKNISRKLKVGKIDDVRAIMANPQISKSELQSLYNRFDMTFLHLYPRFVPDFNALLRPEEQIVLKKGELLNTELRIYALVRLGINDSVKIAEFLHMSPQTIYNCRLKTRNKAVVPKEEFTDRVRALGKAPRPASSSPAEPS